MLLLKTLFIYLGEKSSKTLDRLKSVYGKRGKFNLKRLDIGYFIAGMFYHHF